ncbi:MAG: energy-coupling factor transporter ATPase [Desulfosoma sp.]
MHWQATPIAARSPSQAVLFHLDDVSYTYPDGKEALRGVSLSIAHGEKIALVGQNGSGKTTLAKVLCGLISPSRGRVIFDGRPIGKEALSGLRKQVGILFQDPDDHLFCNRVVDDVVFGPLNDGASPEEASAIVSEMLDLVGLGAHGAKAPHHLSYGQRKRAALAAILARRPSVLILDEPTANLDSRNAERLLDVLDRFSGTLLCISHDLMFLYGLCHRAVVLHRGAVHHDTDFQALIAHRPSLREHGLDFTFRFHCCSGPHGAASHGHSDPEAVSKIPREKSRLQRTESIPSDHGAQPPARPEANPVSHRIRQRTRSPLIALEDYSYRYPDGTWGLRRVSLHMEDGERIALLGENGAGKSTLASVLVGIRTGRGVYRFGGEAVRGRMRKELWRSVGIVFQDSMDQMVCASCFDEVAFGLKHLGFREPQLSRRVHEALSRVGLDGMAERVPHHLSAGERKRLSLAAVLAMEPRVLILDEPTANLDPENEERLLGLLDDLPTTLILISHDICFVSALTDRTVVLHQGCVVQDLPTPRFLMDDGLQSRYGLDVTYHNRCCRQILSMHGA